MTEREKVKWEDESYTLRTKILLVSNLTTFGILFVLTIGLGKALSWLVFAPLITVGFALATWITLIGFDKLDRSKYIVPSRSHTNTRKP